MSFHPRMFSQVKGFQPLNAVSSLSLNDVVLDYWQVDSQPGAHGRYVSMHPRLVFVLDNRKLLLQQQKSDKPRRTSAFFIPAGMEIRSSVDETGAMRHLDLHFSLKTLQAIVGHNASLRTPFLFRDLGQLEPFAEILASECETPQRDQNHVFTLVRALVQEHFHRSHGQSAGQARSQIDPAKLESTILENADRRISVDELARQFGLSRSQFNRVFRSEHGQSPQKWITRLKIEKAKVQLSQGHRIAEVADSLGFSDQAHFNRVFKSMTGHAPGIWMKRSEQHADAPNLQDRR